MDSPPIFPTVTYVYDRADLRQYFVREWCVADRGGAPPGTRELVSRVVGTLASLWRIPSYSCPPCSLDKSQDLIQSHGRFYWLDQLSLVPLALADPVVCPHHLRGESSLLA